MKVGVRVRWRWWLLSDGRAAREARRWLYHGHRVECPCCGTQSRRYMADHYRRDGVCRACRSEERHRALRLLLDERFTRTAELRVLHFAPEGCLQPWVRALRSARYVTADVERPDVRCHVDMTAMGARDGWFDLIIASHVLEHIADDGAALRELHRILRPGGRALLMVPIEAGRPQTYEDPSITTPEGRLASYYQSDHVRLYGLDFADRVEAAGFRVELVRPSEQLPSGDVVRYGLRSGRGPVGGPRMAPPDEIYVATK